MGLAFLVACQEFQLSTRTERPKSSSLKPFLSRQSYTLTAGKNFFPGRTSSAVPLARIICADFGGVTSWSRSGPDFLGGTRTRKLRIVTGLRISSYCGFRVSVLQAFGLLSSLKPAQRRRAAVKTLSKSQESHLHFRR